MPAVHRRSKPLASAATMDRSITSGDLLPPGTVAPRDGAPTPAGTLPTRASEYGPNYEQLEERKPKVVAALRDLVMQYRQEGIVARRHEIRRIRQARLFWQGLHYAWWNPQDMSWHLPYEGKIFGDARDLEEMPRYQFVTNFYQGFGLSFIAVISQDVPTTRFYPQSAQSEEDISAAKAASKAAQLVEQNNRVQEMLTGVGYFLWTDGKIGGYVRYVADGQRFGFRDTDVVAPAFARLGEDAYLCSNCRAETPAGARQSFGGLAGALCPQCGATLGQENFKPAERVRVPQVVGRRRVPNGQEVISIVGGLELNTPVWANEMHEYPYLQWQVEVHRAKLKASYPHASDKIQMGGPQGVDDIYARASRVAVAQGLPVIHPGDALHNLITFSRTWIRPWAFYALEDKGLRDELLELFPDGCYVAFAGETYCEARSETMEDHWRVMHAMPGDGQNRPSLGDSLVQVQERYNILSNIQAETYEFGIPPIYADPQVLDFDALQNQVAEPCAHYPARARPGQPLAAGFYQPAPAQVPPDMLRHQQDLVGPVAQFLTGLFPAVFGGDMENVKTATGYSIARDQAMGRLGLVWRRLKQFYVDLMLLGVDCFRKNRPEDVEIPILGEGGQFEAQWIRLADLKGNIQVHPEADESFPRLKSQQRAVLQQLMASPDPIIQRILVEPDNLEFIKSAIGLTEIVIPGEDSRNKQLREIQQLLAAAPTVVMLSPDSVGAKHPSSMLPGQPDGGADREILRPGRAGAQNDLQGRGAAIGDSSLVGELPGAPVMDEVPSVGIDELLDDHAVEFEVCRRWANSDAGQTAKMENPLGFANVRAHAHQHLVALRKQASAPAADSRVQP